MELTPESLGTAPSHGRLTGRRVVVVGAGTCPSADPDAPIGNGRAMAVLCAREGASVACVDVDKDAAEHTAKLCAQEGAKTATIVADVRDADACNRLVHDADDGLGGLDGVVANVGFGYGTDLANTSPEVWDEIFAVNAWSHFLVARAALPIVDDGSTIVFVGSAASLKAGTHLPAYDASKAALFGLCRHVALEGAQRGIRANLVVPGPVDTPLGRWASASMPSRAKSICRSAGRRPCGTSPTRRCSC